MSKREKTIFKWLNNTPTEEKLETVLGIIEYYFESYRQKGSHIIVKDMRLAEQGLSLNFAIKNGQKVKGFYLQRIAKLIKQVEE